jgi:uncharacterized protein YeeX (DUF496 family)
MTDAQIVSLAITLFAIAAGSMFNNVRISDSTNATNKRFDDFGKRIDDLRDLMKSEHSKLDMKLDRIEQTLSAMVGDHERRIRALEERAR